jgi:hypothetical protein
VPTPQTPAEWLPVLETRLTERRPEIDRLRSYTNGNAPLPEMGRNLRATWERFQKKARTNYGGLAINAVLSRCIPQGVVIAGNDDAQAAAERIWRDNRARIQIKQAMADAAACRVGYLLISLDEGRAVLSARKPESFIAAPDPLKPWKARAYLSMWSDVDEGLEYAYVGTAGLGQMFSRPLKADDYSPNREWRVASEPDAYKGDPKVVIVERPSGHALVEPHFDLIDRINLGKLNRLVITAMQAFRQRALKSKDGGGLPATDLDGNEINWAAAFEPAPGALWELPEGIADIWESEPADIGPLLEAEKVDARDFAAVTRIPVSVFTPEGANQSAQGASVAQDGLYSQAAEEIEAIKPGADMAIVYALQAEGVDLNGATVEVQWAPVELVTMAEKYDAASKAKGIGLSMDTIRREILGMTPQQIEADDNGASNDALNLALANVNANGA